MQTRSERTPTQFYIPNTKTEISISSTLAEMIESSKFRSASAIRKKPLKFKARQIFTDLGNPYLQDELMSNRIFGRLFVRHRISVRFQAHTLTEAEDGDDGRGRRAHALSSS